MTKGADLYRLQCLDSERDAKQRRLAEVEAALGESEALKQAQQVLERARMLVRELTVRQRDLELEIQGVSDKNSRSEKRLYSGAVKNPKELADLQAEIAALQRRRRKLEDDLLETMIEREEGEATHARAQEHLDETQAQWSDQQEELAAEREMLQEALAEIEQARVSLLPDIEASDMASYRGLRRRKGGRAVVQVRNGACGGCGIAVSPSLEWQLRQGELIHCGNCERIIVSQDD
jgi:predicted  nucleic acid-binding Zn-ribbon protein